VIYFLLIIGYYGYYSQFILKLKMSKFGKGKDSFSEVSFENKQRQIEERL